MTVATELAALRAELAELKAQFRTSRRERIQTRPSGKEVPDPRPVEIPVNISRGPPSVAELVQGYVAGEMSQWAAAQDLGTFEDEDDFDEEDPEVLDLSGFEVTEYEMEEEALDRSEDGPTEDPPSAPPPPVDPSVETPPEPTEAPPST